MKSQKSNTGRMKGAIIKNQRPFLYTHAAGRFFTEEQHFQKTGECGSYASAATLADLLPYLSPYLSSTKTAEFTAYLNNGN